jgi:hypothetical protein
LRLDFNVLWVDDQPNGIAAQIASITRKMEEGGFLFNPTSCRSVEEVEGIIANNVFTDEIDLILVDWDLGDGVRGQEVIEKIRDIIQYKDIVFYSGLTAPMDLRKLVYQKDLEGIYCASREHLVEEVMGVFESLVKKVLDLDHTRGIVMGATSDIDYIVNECLTVIHDKSDAVGKDALLIKAHSCVRERVKDVTNKAQKLGSATTLAEFMEAHLIFTANDRLRVLAKVLETKAFTAHREYRKKVIDYQKDVVPDRNRLGHMVLVPEGKLKAVIDNKGNQITVQRTRELRRLILQFRTDFRDLLSALKMQGVATAADQKSGDAK